mmetsp:Transcript_26863/g.58758  ORF Transcript_26863/g.58758 Transcript_26863/m.58758 type:complete len:207 (-) Transcript_26863:362-982(-)
MLLNNADRGGAPRLLPRYDTSTGYCRPSLLTMLHSPLSSSNPPSARSRLPPSPPTSSPSSVALITTRCKSSRKLCCTSRHKANPVSVRTPRSWNSSNMIVDIPVSSGSSRTMLSRMPSVTTNIRVEDGDCLTSPRIMRPMVCPTLSLSEDAIRVAADRAATRRGSTRIILPPSFSESEYCSNKSASGTMVVLPAPGGASRSRLGRP